MSTRNFMICIENADFPTSLEKRKIYEVVADESAAEVGYIRIIDESGDDYLYPASCFINAQLPKAVEEAVANVA